MTRVSPTNNKETHPMIYLLHRIMIPIKKSPNKTQNGTNNSLLEKTS